MPRLIPCDSDETIELGELIEMLETQPFDGRDEECFASWGPALKKLANNRRFLGDIIVEELKSRCEGQLKNNQYTPQVIMLHTGSHKFMMRANFWPAMNDSVVHNSGASPFFYGVPHDHSFSFLTVGYLGSGYWSEYYEYEYDKVAGYTGEKVDLRFIEKARLDQGKVMLYRAHRDVHNQLPADDMSISLNIAENSHSIPFRDQYRFDTKKSEIAGIISVLSLESLVAVAAHFGGDNGRDLIDDFIARHPSERMRFHALRAKASTAADLDARIALFDEASRSSSLFLAAMAKQEAKKLEKGRAWIEAGPRPLQPVA